MTTYEALSDLTEMVRKNRDAWRKNAEWFRETRGDKNEDYIYYLGKEMAATEVLDFIDITKLRVAVGCESSSQRPQPPRLTPSILCKVP